VPGTARERAAGPDEFTRQVCTSTSGTRLFDMNQDWIPERRSATSPGQPAELCAVQPGNRNQRTKKKYVVEEV
jgi:hypothetical protein